MDEQFEKKINDGVQASAHPITKNAADILSAYHGKEQKKKPSSYKAPFYGALGALACAVVALAVLLPTTFEKQTEGTSSLPEDYSLSDIEVSPLKNDQDVLGYELSTLYPLVKPLSTKGRLAAYSGAGLSLFEEAVAAYEPLQAPIRSTFLGKGEALGVESGSYSGTYGIYASKMVLPDVGELYFNAVSLRGRWSVLTGELAADGEVRRFEGRQRSTDTSKSVFGLKLFGSDEGDYSIVEQNENQGRFSFAFQLFNSYQLASSLSLRLMRANGEYPFILANAFSSAIYETTTFKVLAVEANLYSLYTARVSKISLSYENSQRIYKNNGSTITK